MYEILTEGARIRVTHMRTTGEVRVKAPYRTEMPGLSWDHFEGAWTGVVTEEGADRLVRILKARFVERVHVTTVEERVV